MTVIAYNHNFNQQHAKKLFYDFQKLKFVNFEAFMKIMFQLGWERHI